MIKSLISAGAIAAGISTGAMAGEDGTILEIAWFKLVPGTEAAQMIDGAQHVQDHFLPRFDGRIFRELLAEDDGDFWIDSIHWRSVGDFSKAAAEIMTDPDGAPIMELIDPSSLAWFHADLVQHWKWSEMPNGDGFTELKFFRLVAPGSEVEFLTPTTDDQFLKAAHTIQPTIEMQDGFVDRELFRTEDGWWIDLLRWTTKEAADNASLAIHEQMGVEGSPASAFAVQIDPKSLKVFSMNQVRVW